MYYEKIAGQRYAMIDKVLKRQTTLKSKPRQLYMRDDKSHYFTVSMTFLQAKISVLFIFPIQEVKKRFKVSYFVF